MTLSSSIYITISESTMTNQSEVQQQKTTIMAAPIKPWEISGVNQQYDRLGSSPGTNYMSSNPSIISSPIGGATAQPLLQPPQIPPRPTSTPLNSTYNRYGYGGVGGYGGGGGLGYGMGGSSYGMYNSPYSMYGGGYGMNRYGMTGEQQTGTFARHAEDSSRNAFESIESIVNAFTSVSMMLDSTFQAVYNSFRAVIGVADNFSRLKIQMMQVVSALAFIRTLKYMYRKLLEFLRLRPPGTAVDEWNRTFAAAAKSVSGDPEVKKSSWPILMFFGIILGGPWFIWKLISSFTSTASDTPTWADGQGDHFVADVLYDFTGESKEEISVKVGQRINIAPKEIQPRLRGWLLASNMNGKTGLVPATYVKVLGKRRGQKSMTLVDTNPQLVSDHFIEPTESSLNLVQNQQTINENEMDNLFNDTLPIVSSDENTNPCENKSMSASSNSR